jgi:hypothetical protein
MTPQWYLVLMIWGDAYGDAVCNRLIRQAYAYGRGPAGVVVLTDRTDRDLDARALQCPIPADFDQDAYKTGGLPVKIALFDIAALPKDAVCVYVDLDSAIIGDAGRLAALTSPAAPIWTLPTPRGRFNAVSRLVWRRSKGRRFGAGNSSVFAYRNGFAGNPTQKFRDHATIFGLSGDSHRSNDDRFIAWSCQDLIRPIPRDLAVRFRIEFLELSATLNRIKAVLRHKPRQRLAIVTFDGSLTKPETIAAFPQGALITDHHGRRGYWTQAQTSGLRTRLLAALRD